MARNKSDDAATPIKDGLRIHLREIRKRAGLTQEEIAEALDTDAGNVSRWETGSIAIVSRHLAAIARAYRCDVREIFSLADEPEAGASIASGADPRDFEIRLLHQRVNELREDRNAWRSQAQVVASIANKSR